MKPMSTVKSMQLRPKLSDCRVTQVSHLNIAKKPYS